MAKPFIRFSDTLKCPVKKKALSVVSCIDGYVSANAFNQTDNPCFNCQIGREKRELFVPEYDSEKPMGFSLPLNLVRKKFKRILD